MTNTTIVTVSVLLTVVALFWLSNQRETLYSKIDTCVQVMNTENISHKRAWDSYAIFCMGNINKK